MVEIKNRELSMVLGFLRNDLVTSDGVENIHRMRIVKNLESRCEELEEERIEIIKQFSKKDESGEIIQNEDGNIEIFNANQMNKQLNLFFEENYIIKDPNLETALKTIARLVEGFEGELSGDSGEAHYILIESLGISIEEDK